MSLGVNRSPTGAQSKGRPTDLGRGQAPHPNLAKGTTVEEQDHPTTAKFISALFRLGEGGDQPKLDWINCGLCVDERGAGDWIEGPRRGGPGDLLKLSQASTNTLTIGTH